MYLAGQLTISGDSNQLYVWFVLENPPPNATTICTCMYLLRLILPANSGTYTCIAVTITRVRRRLIKDLDSYEPEIHG